MTFGEITLGGAITVSLAGLPELADIAVVYAPSLVVVAADSHSTTTAAEPAWETIKAQVAYNEADESIMASLGVAAGTTDPAGIRQWVHENLQVPAEMSLRHYRDVGARSLNLPIVELEPNDKRFQFAIQYYELLDSAAFKPPTTDPFGAIIIDPDFLSEIDEFTVSCGLTLAETVHHELFHAVFRAYDIRALGRGLTRAGYWTVVGRGYDEGLATTVSRSHISGASAGNAAVRTCTKSEVFPLGLNFGDGVREGRQYGNQDVFAYLERAYTRDGFAFLWGDEGLLERMVVRSEEVVVDFSTRADDFLQAHHRALDDVLGAASTPAMNLHEAFASFIRNRFYEHDDASDLRPEDSQDPAYHARMSRFEPRTKLRKEVSCNTSFEVGGTIDHGVRAWTAWTPYGPCRLPWNLRRVLTCSVAPLRERSSSTSTSMRECWPIIRSTSSSTRTAAPARA